MLRRRDRTAARRRVRASRGSRQSALATVLALGWGRLWGGSTRFDAASGIFVCTGMRGGYARGGTTIGGVFLTGRPTTPALLRHEAIHADQWARHGLVFAVSYLLEELRRPGARNRFEVAAGLADGGYRVTNPAATPPVRTRRARGSGSVDHPGTGRSAS